MIKNEKLKFLNILLWIVSAAAMIGLFELWSRFFKEDIYGLLLEFAVVTAAMFLFLYLISGKKTFSKMGSATFYTVKTLLPSLVFPGMFMLFGLISLTTDRPELNPDWKMDLLLFAAEMFLVGVYEETCYRACSADAMLPAFRKLRRPFFLTALISSLAFGYVHVADVDWSDLHQLLQFALKIATTGMYGATLMIVYWKTRDLLGIAIIHFLGDFLPSALEYVFLWKDLEELDSYTSGDIETTVVYLVQFVFNLWILIRTYRKVWPSIDREKTLEEW